VLYRVARALQLIGLIVVPFAITGNLAEKLNVPQMLIVAGVGVAIFTSGWLLQQVVRPK
jgi:hypothetical protein